MDPGVRHPDEGLDLFRDQAQSLVDPDLRRIYLDYDRCRDLDPADPPVDELARRIVDATRRRSGPWVPPAWRRLDALIRAQPAVRPATGVGE